MARLPFDLDWAALTRRLAAVSLPALSIAESDQLRAKLTNRHLFRRVCIRPGASSPTWEVRMYLGKSQRMFVTVRGATAAIRDDVVAGNLILRIADAVMVHFNKYRSTWAHPPASHEYNFSSDRAVADLEQSADLIGILSEMENYLLAAGALDSAEQLEANHAKQITTGKRVYGYVSERRNSAEIAELRNRFEKMESAYQDLQSQISALRADVGRLHYSNWPVPHTIGDIPGAPPSITCGAGETKKDVVTPSVL
jgi:hypothetical protein